MTAPEAPRRPSSSRSLVLAAADRRRQPASPGPASSASLPADLRQPLRPPGRNCSATRGVTAASLHAQASCDKGGPKVADVGPGARLDLPDELDRPERPDAAEGYGKFELNVHSNDCYTAGGPSKLIGPSTITDTHGREVTNPVFEFDGCFDPDARVGA